MIKKLLALLITISINALDTREDFHSAVDKVVADKESIEGYFGKYEYICSYGPSIYNAEILKAKYDLDLKDGKAGNDKYLAKTDANYYIKIYKKDNNGK